MRSQRAEETQELPIESEALLVTRFGQREPNPLERLSRNSDRQEDRFRDGAFACICALALIAVVGSFTPGSSTGSSTPGFEFAASAKSHLPPTNEKILLNSKEEIDEFFGRLSEKRIFLLSVPTKVDHLTKMAMCAAESAARFNPDYDVVLLQGFYNDTAKSTGLSGSASKSAYEGILNMSNVYFADFNISEYVRGTNIEDFWNNTISTAKKTRNLHISDTLRLSLLYEYGGFYSDLDAIFLRSIANYSNAIGYEGQKRRDEPAKGYQVVNNAVLAFEGRHPFVGEYINRWINEYNNSRVIGAVILATVLGSECTDNPALYFCKGVSFVEYGEFYWIGWGGIEWYRQLRDENPEKFDRSFKQHTNKSIVHIWNSFKKGHSPFRPGDVSTTNEMYGALMNYGCPFVFEHQKD